MTKYREILRLTSLGVSRRKIVSALQVSQKTIVKVQIEQRIRNASTIFCSQYRDSGWYERLGGSNSPLSEAVLDRIVHDAYRIDITSIDPEHGRSMREVYGLDQSLTR